jgi:hypothetical protein
MSLQRCVMVVHNSKESVAATSATPLRQVQVSFRIKEEIYRSYDIQDLHLRQLDWDRLFYSPQSIDC